MQIPAPKAGICISALLFYHFLCFNSFTLRPEITMSLRLLFLLVMISGAALQPLAAQENIRELGKGRLKQVTTETPQYDRNGRVIPPSQRSKNDSLKRRDENEDSVTIYFRYFDSTKTRFLDSSVNDFNARFPIPWTHLSLGNNGNATRSMIFQPLLKAGFDAGFHAYDAYLFTLENTKFYQTTRPFTQMGYMLGSKAEQMVSVMQTQNFKSNFNYSLEYRLINSPGNYKNQNTNHNNIRLTGNYQSKNKRYSAALVVISNKLKSAENGGIQFDSLLNDSRFNDRFLLATRLGTNSSFSRNPFSTVINTGTFYTDDVILLRQQYDLGTQVSKLNEDSSITKLFYPRLRLQYNLKYSKQRYRFTDFITDSAAYADYMAYPIGVNDTVSFSDQWTSIQNEFAIITFPEKQNLNQFLKLGAALQYLRGNFANSSERWANFSVSGEYRNRTRNQKWDIEAAARLFVSGLNKADYEALIKMKTLLSKKLGYLETGFQNVNRTPSYVFNAQSAFPTTGAANLNKENYTRLFGTLNIPATGIQIAANYYLVSNYTYFDSMYSFKQEGTLFNILQIGLTKKFKLSRKWNWYTEIYLQQTTGNPPVHIPFLLTRNRLAFEGTFYKNLRLSTGLELRYHSPFKADGYSPLLGQFYFQDRMNISNRPDINAYLNFCIKRFYAFIRLENLNTLASNTGGIGFTKPNVPAPNYAGNGMWLHLGIVWNFVN